MLSHVQLPLSLCLSILILELALPLKCLSFIHFDMYYRLHLWTLHSLVRLPKSIAISFALFKLLISSRPKFPPHPLPSFLSGGGIGIRSKLSLALQSWITKWENGRFPLELPIENLKMYLAKRNPILMQKILYFPLLIHSNSMLKPCATAITIIPSRVRRRYFTVRSPFAIAFPPSFRYRAHYIAYTKPPMRTAAFPPTAGRGAEDRSKSERRSAKGGADIRELAQTPI